MVYDGRELAPKLGLFDATFIGVGGIIGSAIFLAPSAVMKAHPSPLSAMLVFAFAGLISLFGALAYAELGTMYPDTGGEYLYLRESWGPPWAFLCGWTYFLVTFTGGIATIAVGFASIVASMVPIGAVLAKACAVVLVIALTAINYAGIRIGATVNNLLNVMKLFGIAVMLAATLANPVIPAVDWSWPRGWTLSQFATALVPCLWSFEGWNLIPLVSGEIRNPRRTMPRALTGSLAIVFLVYAASLWIYFHALPVDRIAASTALASDAAIAQLGSRGGMLVGLTMLVALAGCANASVLGCPRLYFAMAKDGAFFRQFAQVHPVFRTPAKALLWQCAWAIALTISGSYESLLAYCTFGSWIFYTMTVAGLLRLRRTQPAKPRPYRMTGYPYTTICFLFVASAFVLSTLVTEPLTSLGGLALIATGLPLYRYLKRRAT